MAIPPSNPANSGTAISPTDLADPGLYRLNQVLQKLDSRIGQTNTTVKTIVEQQGGSTTTTTGTQSFVGTHSQRLSGYAPASYAVGSFFFETDRMVLYEVQPVGTANQWSYIGGVMKSAVANQPADLGIGDTGFLFLATDTMLSYYWSGAAWVIVTNEKAIAEAEWLTSVAGTNTITATTVAPYTALAAGFTAKFIPANTNTGATTLNVNATGAKAVTKNGTNALVGGELPAGKICIVVYDGTRWQIPVPIGPTSATLLASDANGVPSAAVLASGKLFVGSIGNLPVAQTPGGDLTMDDSANFTLDAVNGAPGTFGDGTHVAEFTVNGKGLVTSAIATIITGMPGFTGTLAAAIAAGKNVVNGIIQP